MSTWAQASILMWLIMVFGTGVMLALRQPTRSVVLVPNAQRRIAASVAVSAVVEAALLWMGGFFKGMF